ncbi:MAG: cytidine deaminase [Vicingaceae bacterium]|nr:MAG: cytidine deaminase [Vicingaceae bacterium]
MSKFEAKIFYFIAMKNKPVKFVIHDSVEALDEIDKKYLQQTMQYLNHAYAPYSNFLVAAGVLLSNEEFILGTNQENIAYPSGLCAERVALFFSNSKFPDASIKAMYLASSKIDCQSNDYFSPCGSCRQVMIEFIHLHKSDFPLYILQYNQTVMEIPHASDLLPFSFSF